MKKMKWLIAAFFTVAIMCLFTSAPVAAYTYYPSFAVIYADAHWNNDVPLYGPFPSDCTNFVSQILLAGGLTENNDWYFNHNLSYSATWAVADDLKWYVKVCLGATKLSPGWSRYGTPNPYFTYAYYNSSTGQLVNNSNNILNTGDVIIFYDWGDKTPGKMDHASYCVGTGYSADNTGYGDLIDQHTHDRYRTIWHLDSHNNTHRETTAIYAFQL